MTDYGVTPQGFVLKPMTVIVDELQNDLKSVFGNQIDLGAETVFGQFVGVISERVSDIWELSQASYNSRFRSSASGVSLDNVGDLTGVKRIGPATSIVYVTAIGIPGTVLSAGRIFSVTGTGAKFTTIADATLDGSGSANILCQSVDEGPIPAPAGTLTTIETPVSGLTSVTNTLDAKLGRLIETDPAYRIRQSNENGAAGSSTFEATRTDILEVDGVLEAFVYENDTDSTDGYGRPPHTIEAVVRGGDDDAVRSAIFGSKAAGIDTVGTTVGTVTDSQLTTHTIRFNRPTEKNVYVIVDVTKQTDPAKPQYPVDGDDQVKAAIVAYGQANYGIADDVITHALFAPVLGVQGVIDVPLIYVGLTSSPTFSANLPMDIRDIPILDTSRIVVVSS